MQVLRVLRELTREDDRAELCWIRNEPVTSGGVKQLEPAVYAYLRLEPEEAGMPAHVCELRILPELQHHVEMLAAAAQELETGRPVARAVHGHGEREGACSCYSS